MPKRRFTEQERMDGSRAWTKMSEKAQKFYEETPDARLWKTDEGFFMTAFGGPVAGPYRFKEAEMMFELLAE